MQKNNYYRVSLIVLTLLQIGLSALYLNSLSRIENWSAVYAEDSRGYVLVADYLNGKDISAGEQSLMRYRLFSPLVPFAASLLGNLTGIPAAFLIINILLWLITPLLFYGFLKTVLQDDFFAFAGAAILTTSLPLIEWGLPVMVDMGSYFFACLIPFLYLRWFQPAPPPSRERVQDDFPSPRGRGLRGGGGIKNIFMGITLALALLTKPMLIILLLFMLFSLIYEKRYTSIAVTCGLPVVLVIAVYSAFSLTYNDFTTFGSPRHRGLIYLFTAALFCYHGGWLFLRQGWKSTPSYRHLYLIYIISFAVPYLVFVHNPRLFFLSYPAVIALIVQGIRQFFRQRQYTVRAGAALFGAYIVTSNILTIFHLYIMRYLKVRDWEGLLQFFK